MIKQEINELIRRRGFPMIYREMQQLGKAVSVRELGEELRVVLSL